MNIKVRGAGGTNRSAIRVYRQVSPRGKKITFYIEFVERLGDEIRRVSRGQREKGGTSNRRYLRGLGRSLVASNESRNIGPGILP